MARPKVTEAVTVKRPCGAASSPAASVSALSISASRCFALLRKRAPASVMLNLRVVRLNSRAFEPVLERGNGARHGGRRQAQPRARLGEAAGLGNGDEDFHLAQTVHGLFHISQ